MKRGVENGLAVNLGNFLTATRIRRRSMRQNVLRYKGELGHATRQISASFDYCSHTARLVRGRLQNARDAICIGSRFAGVYRAVGKGGQVRVDLS